MKAAWGEVDPISTREAFWLCRAGRKRSDRELDFRVRVRARLGKIQPRRGDLKVAQDAVLGCVQKEISSPGGTAESILNRFSRPPPDGGNPGRD